jgi:hypothetical protein
LDVKDWALEHIPDTEEGTNVDVYWSDGENCVFCEVKLSEAGFGAAMENDRRLRKLESIYLPRLRGWLPATSLEPAPFFRHYQLLRNVALLRSVERSRVLFLLPRANAPLVSQLHSFLDLLDDAARARVSAVYIEDCIATLVEESSTPALRNQAAALRAKYVIPARWREHESRRTKEHGE